MFLEKSAYSIPSGVKIAIYGAGKLGMILKKWLEKNREDSHVIMFFDSYKEGDFCGLPLVNVQKIHDHISEFDVVVVASQYGQEIAETLSSLKIEPFIVIDKKVFLDRDLSIDEYNYLQLSLVKSRKYLPVRMCVELASVCNLKCSMCSRSKKINAGGIMSIETAAKTFEQCKDYGIEEIFLGGSRGESLLNENFFSILDMAVKAGFKTFLTTNGTLLDKERINRLVESGITNFEISFCGYDKQSYENVYVGANFEHTVECIKYVHDKITLLENPPSFAALGVMISNDISYAQKTRLFLKSLGLEDSEMLFLIADNFRGNSDYGIYHPRIKASSLMPIDDSCPILCDWLTDQWVTYTDGKVAPCGCRNHLGLVTLGNIYENSLSYMADNFEYRNIIDCFCNGDIRSAKLCSKCDIPYRRFHSEKFWDGRKLFFDSGI